MRKILLIFTLVLALAVTAGAYEVKDQFNGMMWLGEVSTDAFYGPAPTLDYIAWIIQEDCGVVYDESQSTCEYYGQKPCEAHLSGKLPGGPVTVNLFGRGHAFIYNVLFLPKKGLTVKQATNQGSKLNACVRDAILSIDY